ncbi:MAG: hypothetical protein HUJ75_03950 [Parasporobacterium sp.]|nr:hypothetical protein [Parasporobacterium sp.]
MMIIKKEDWDRKYVIPYYEDTDFPYIPITANVDVTKPLQFARDNKISFNLTMVYLANSVADSIINYRYRLLENGDILVIDHNIPTINHLRKGIDAFVIGEGIWPCDDIVKFCKETHAHLEQCEVEDNLTVNSRQEVLNYTSIPWINYTGFMRTIPKFGPYSNPKISFGKYAEQNGRILMPVSSQTHHMLMDGRHVGQFYEKLQAACENI